MIREKEEAVIQCRTQPGSLRIQAMFTPESGEQGKTVSGFGKELERGLEDRSKLAQLPLSLLWWKRGPQRLANRAREAELSLQRTVPSVLPQVSPVPQVRDADQLDDIDPYLTKKYKEEHEEAERVVRPVERRGKPEVTKGLGAHPSIPHMV